MNENQDFYTLKGYELAQKEPLSTAMQDYLEMICRMLQKKEVVRIKELAQNLHVKPSSASKMVNNLKELGYVNFERYGYIELTKMGLVTGSYLLHRHDVLHNFLCELNNSENELEQVEKIEHYFNQDTIHNLEIITPKIKEIRNHRDS